MPIIWVEMVIWLMLSFEKVTNGKILVRLDAGNDSIENIKVFMEEKVLNGS